MISKSLSVRKTVLATTSIWLNILIIMTLIVSLLALSARQVEAAISTTTYVFTSASGATLEDLSSGATNLIGGNWDDQNSMVTDIGFDFWFDGMRYTQFSINANGLMKLGSTGVSANPGNNLAIAADNPKIAPYWDDLYTGVNGKVLYTVLGSAPSRKLVVEWRNMQIPRVGVGNLGAGTFQAWLYETRGVIEFVYGNGIVTNAGGYSVGIASSGTAFASVTTNGPTVSYTTSDNTQTTAIASGAKYTFTPPIPNAPGGLVFSSLTPSSMQLDWMDNSSDELGFAIYRSSDGGATYKFIAQVGAGGTTYIASFLTWCSPYTWKVVAVTEGGVSNDLINTASTLCGGMSGVFTIDPVGPATFPSLTTALAAITGAGISGPITLELLSTYTPAAEVFPITIDYTKSSAAFPLTIRPIAGSGPLAIFSNNTTATLDLNGAVNVTIDGRPGGVGALHMLTIDNLVNAPAIRLINDALNNTIQFVDIRGANASTTSGVVGFSTAGPNSIGNDDNLLNKNAIHSGAATPANGIHGLGTVPTANAANDVANSGNRVIGNMISDFFQPAALSDGINLQAGNTGWVIVANRFHQSALRTSTGGATHSGIYINDALGQDFVIRDNQIGGNGAGGDWQMRGAFANRFVGISLYNVGGARSVVVNNAISDFDWTSTNSASSPPGVWCGIFARGSTTPVGGAVDILGNTVGAIGSSSSVSVTVSVNGGVSYGIVSSSIAGGITSGNNVSSITVSGSNTTVSHSFVGIHADYSANTLVNNTIGDATTPNSIDARTASTSGTGQFVIGIRAAGNGEMTIGRNTVVNLNNNYAGTASTGAIRGIQTTVGSNNIEGNAIYNLSTSSPQTGTGVSASAIGILQTSSVTGQTVARNKIHSLSSTAGAAAVSVLGIYYKGSISGANVVERNFVHNLSLASSAAGASLVGIYTGSGLTTYRNNMVQLGLDAAGVSVGSPASIYGIYDTASYTNTQVVFNTVYIGGNVSAPGTASNSAAIYRTTINPEDYRDNILFNARSNPAPGTGKNIAMFTDSATGLGATTCDYNLYFATGTGGAAGQVSITPYATLSAWQTATGFDANSVWGDPNLTTPAGSSATTDLHLIGWTLAEGRGADIPSVTEDYDGEVRAGYSPVDIGADAGDFLVSTTFVYRDLEDIVYSGEQVALAGDFNSWNPNALIMTSDAGMTTFTATLFLQAGSTYGYKYVVKSGGDQWDWLQTNNRSLVAANGTIHNYRNVVVSWANLQYPTALTITLGQNTGNIYGRVLVNNVTNPAGQGRGIHAELGYGTDVTPSAWAWSSMLYNMDYGVNDEYQGVITPTLTGVYSYTTRYDGNWGMGNPNRDWSLGDINGAPPFNIHDVGVLTVITYYTLTMNTIGNGSVTPSVGEHSYINGSVVTLTATADAGWTFAGWSGDLSGMTTPIQITMDDNKTVTATFIQVYPIHLPIVKTAPSPVAWVAALLAALQKIYAQF